MRSVPPACDLVRRLSPALATLARDRSRFAATSRSPLADSNRRPPPVDQGGEADGLRAQGADLVVADLGGILEHELAALAAGSIRFGSGIRSIEGRAPPTVGARPSDRSCQPITAM
jgi:hypothetical protein